MAKRRGRGEGSIEELPSGKFRVVLSLGRDPATGKRRKLQETFDTKKAALAWKHEQQTAHGKGQLADAGKLTVGQWIDQWLEAKRAKVEANTYRYYEIRVRRFLKPMLGDTQLGRLRTLDVESLFARMTADGHSAAEQRNAATTLRASLQDAVRHNLIPSNPAARVKKPKAQAREIKALDQHQARQLLAAAAADRLAAIFDLMLDAGCRPGEAFGLHWADVDLEGAMVFFRQSLENYRGELRLKAPKTARSRRKVRLARRTVEVLRRHRESMRAEGRDVVAGPVFPDTRGGLLQQSNFHKTTWRPARDRAGLAGFRFNDLRHTSATLLLGSGVSLRVVADRLGHETPATTLKFYAAALPDQQQAAADTFDRLLSDCPTNVPQTLAIENAVLPQFDMGQAS
jgi:integrase